MMSFVVSTVDPLKRLLDSYFVDVIFIIYYGDEGKNCGRLHFLKMFTAIFLFLHALTILVTPMSKQGVYFLSLSTWKGLYVL